MKLQKFHCSGGLVDHHRNQSLRTKAVYCRLLRDQKELRTCAAAGPAAETEEISKLGSAIDQVHKECSSELVAKSIVTLGGGCVRG